MTKEFSRVDIPLSDLFLNNGGDSSKYAQIKAAVLKWWPGATDVYVLDEGNGQFVRAILPKMTTIDCGSLYYIWEHNDRAPSFTIATDKCSHAIHLMFFLEDELQGDPISDFKPEVYSTLGETASQMYNTDYPEFVGVMDKFFEYHNVNGDAVVKMGTINGNTSGLPGNNGILSITGTGKVTCFKLVTRKP